MIELGLGDLAPEAPDDDSIEKYRDEDILATAAATDRLPRQLLWARAPERRQHMLTVLKWVLAYAENGWEIHTAKLRAFEQTADDEEYDLENKSTLATEVQQAYRHRKQGEGVQALFEDALEDFVSIWEQKQEYC